MVLLTIGTGIGLVLLLLVCAVMTGSVVARLAVHIRAEAWERIGTQQRQLRRRERELDEAAPRSRHDDAVHRTERTENRP